jgi:hypothetical protein
VRREERLGAATVIAIVALWLHVALALVVAVLVLGNRDGGQWAFLFLLGGAAYAAVAMGLERRHAEARPLGIALAALTYGIQLGHGTVISSVLLILIPLLVARPGTVERYSVPPSSEEGVTPLDPLTRLGAPWAPGAPWDRWY